MFGGIIINTEVTNDYVKIICEDSYGHQESLKLENCAKACCISEGDEVWKQMNVCYWTPKVFKNVRPKKCGVNMDIEIKCLSY